jgi:hypothetical protein
MAISPRLGLPLLSAGQAQKEITHNEALVLLDAVTHGCCAGPPVNDPPSAPAVGLSYICGAIPTAAWLGHASDLACWTDGGWRFVEPFDGLEVIDRMSGRTWRFMGGQWSCGLLQGSEVRIDSVKVVGSQVPAIANAAGGSNIDVQARSVLGQVLQALRSHGLIAPSG